MPFGLSDEEVARIVADSNANCDPAHSLRAVLLLLVDANLQEADEDDDTDEMHETKAKAEASLFRLATALTRGYRTVDGAK